MNRFYCLPVLACILASPTSLTWTQALDGASYTLDSPQVEEIEEQEGYPPQVPVIFDANLPMDSIDSLIKLAGYEEVQESHRSRSAAFRRQVLRIRGLKVHPEDSELVGATIALSQNPSVRTVRLRSLGGLASISPQFSPDPRIRLDSLRQGDRNKLGRSTLLVILSYLLEVDGSNAAVNWHREANVYWDRPDTLAVSIQLSRLLSTVDESLKACGYQRELPKSSSDNAAWTEGRLAVANLNELLAQDYVVKVEYIGNPSVILNEPNTK